MTGPAGRSPGVGGAAASPGGGVQDGETVRGHEARVGLGGTPPGSAA